MCLWITKLTVLAQSAHYIGRFIEVWVTNLHAKRCSKLGGLSQIVVDIMFETGPTNLPCNENGDIYN